MNEWLQGNIEMTCLMLYQANFGAECEQHTKKGWEEMGGKEDACVVGEEGEILKKKNYAGGVLSNYKMRQSQKHFSPKRHKTINRCF